MIVPRPWNAGTDGSPPYVMGARMHAPSAAALASMDSHAGAAATPASMNRFLYAEGDPASLVDPTGHTTILVDVAGSTITRIGSTVVTNGPGTETGRVVAQAAATEQKARVYAHDSHPANDPTTLPSQPVAPTTVQIHFIAGVPILPNGQFARPEDYEHFASACQQNRVDPDNPGSLCNSWWQTEEALNAVAGGQSADPVFLTDAALGTLEDAMRKAGQARIDLADVDLRIAYVDASKQLAGDLSITGTGASVSAAEWELTTGGVLKLAGQGLLVVSVAATGLDAIDEQAKLDAGRGYDWTMEAPRAGIRGAANVGAGLGTAYVVGNLVDAACTLATEGGCLIPAAIMGGWAGAAATSTANDTVTKVYGWIDTKSGTWPWEQP